MKREDTFPMFGSISSSKTQITLNSRMLSSLAQMLTTMVLVGPLLFEKVVIQNELLLDAT